MSEILETKIEQWEKGEAPHLSFNEAVVVWFVTGDESTQLQPVLQQA